jgi:hypothetical protein
MNCLEFEIPFENRLQILVSRTVGTSALQTSAHAIWSARSL